MTALARFGLGTVQFGLPYGISNLNPMPDVPAVARMLAQAWTRGCRILDTAAAYGNSEQVIGQALAELAAAHMKYRIVTKTLPLPGIGLVTAAGFEAVRAGFERSLAALSNNNIYGLLIHHADDLLRPGGGVLADWLNSLKAEGRVTKIGASIYTSDEIERLLSVLVPDLLQLPVNLLDQRLIRSGHLRALKVAGCEIHARSPFLQGALLMDPDMLPSLFAPVRSLLKRFHAEALTHGLTPLQACLSFMRSIPEIDAIIVGVTNEAQLHECLNAFSDSPSFDGTNFVCDDVRILNPALWNAS